MNATVSRESHPAQRGFVEGRRLTANIVEMHAYASIFHKMVPDSGCPVLVLLDLLAAFPSINRAFLFRTLEWLPRRSDPDGAGGVC